MGYDLHITRRSNWVEEGNDITSEEWLSLVREDPELVIRPDNGKYFAVWSGKSTQQSPWLDWSKGQISTKNPDDALIDKMVAIANLIGAKVQGDDGEFYSSAIDAHKRPGLTRSSFSVSNPEWLPILLVIGGISFVLMALTSAISAINPGISTGFYIRIIYFIVGVLFSLFAIGSFQLSRYCQSRIEIDQDSATILVKRKGNITSYANEELSFTANDWSHIISIFDKKNRRRLVMFDYTIHNARGLLTWAKIHLSQNKNNQTR